MLEQVFVYFCQLIFGLCLIAILRLLLTIFIRSWIRRKKVLGIGQWRPLVIDILIINQGKGALSIRTIFPLEIIQLDLACLIDSFQAMLHGSQIHCMRNFWLLRLILNSSFLFTLTLIYHMLLVNRLSILLGFLPSCLLVSFILHILIILVYI